jgi:hypothetical protein
MGLMHTVEGSHRFKGCFLLLNGVWRVDLSSQHDVEEYKINMEKPLKSVLSNITIKGEGGFLFPKNREPYRPCTPKTICKMRKNLEHAHCTTKSELSAQEKMELKQISQQFYFFFL